MCWPPGDPGEIGLRISSCEFTRLAEEETFGIDHRGRKDTREELLYNGLTHCRHPGHTQLPGHDDFHGAETLGRTTLQR